MRCLCRTGRACFFLFCLSPVSLNRLFLSGDETSFLSPGVGCCPRIRSQLGHTPPTGPVWGFAGVVSLAGPQNRTQGHTGPSLVFPPKKTNLPLPLKGEGLGIIFLGLLGLPCSFTTGSHWPNRAGLLLRWCRSPTPPSDRPRIATQGRVWFHRLFLLDFLGGNPASCRSRW